MIDETAFAKINLDLRVCRRLDDGYHELDSLVVFAGIGDRLTFEPADSFELKVDGPFAAAVGDGDDNLVMRAARALARSLEAARGASITLDKRLPVAAGLGGGSADAAATLRGLMRLWNEPLSLADLLPLASTLGADVPVCLRSRPVRMRGIGERLTPVDLPDPGPMLLVNPRQAVPTASVFRELETMSGERTEPLVAGSGSRLVQLLLDGVNDLQRPAIRLAPIIGDVLDALGGLPGCLLSRMSGSGATCFGLFEDESALNAAADRLTGSHPDWWIVATPVGNRVDLAAIKLR